jgi:hypothetical protein
MTDKLTIVEHRTAGPMLSVYYGERHLGLIFLTANKRHPFRACPGFPLCDTREDASFGDRSAAIHWLVA